MIYMGWTPTGFAFCTYLVIVVTKWIIIILPTPLVLFAAGSVKYLIHSNVSTAFYIDKHLKQRAFSGISAYLSELICLMQTLKLFNTFSVNSSYVITLRSVFVQANGQLDTLPPFFYYELLVPVTSTSVLVSTISKTVQSFSFGSQENLAQVLIQT